MIHLAYYNGLHTVCQTSIWSIDRDLPCATTAGQSKPRRDGNEGVHCIPQSPNITESLQSDIFMSFTGQSLKALLL